MGVFSVLAEILFVGHSLIGPDLPPLVQAALKEMDGPTSVEAQVINGATLAYNWDHSAEAEGVDARARLGAGAADVLILTEAQPVAGAVQWADTSGRIADFARLGAEARPELRVFLLETWPTRGSGPGVVIKDDPDAGLPWRERLAKDLPLWEGAAAEAAQKAGVAVTLIPAGQAMGALEDAIAAGKVPQISSLDAVFADDIHLNGKGLYFLALVTAAAVSGKSPEGLPAKLTRAWASRDAVISDAQAQALQAVAFAAVQGFVPQVGVEPAAEEVAALAPDVAPPLAPPLAPAPPSFAPITNPNLALGLAGVNDWSVQQPFLDVMKTARPWVGHLPGQWGGWTHDDLAAKGYLDAKGWPKGLPPELSGIATLILTDLPETAGGVAGRYLLTYAGNGSLEISGRASVAEAVPGRLVFDYTPGEGAVILTLTAIDPTDPIRDIVVVRQDRAADLAAGALFNPDWLARLRGVKAIRFMDWMATNDSPLARASDRPKPDDYTWARIGVPMEVMVALANELGADPWFTLPHLAEDGLVRALAQIAHDGLSPGRVALVEYSNEVWNWQFAQARWAEEQAKARWGQDQAWVQFYGLRAAEVMAIWSQVFADDPARLVRIVATQTGWPGLEAQILDAPLVLAEGRAAPGDSFDAYAVTGYFSALLGADDKAPMIRDWLAQSQAAAAGDPAKRYDLAFALAAQELRDGSVSGDPTDSLAQVLAETLPYHATIAANRGLRLMMYEGGSHVVGYGAQMDDAALTDFFTALNYSAEMGGLYVSLLEGWALLSPEPFNGFVDVYRPGKWGSWGALRDLYDVNPRWDALAKGCAKC